MSMGARSPQPRGSLALLAGLCGPSACAQSAAPHVPDLLLAARGPDPSPIPRLTAARAGGCWVWRWRGASRPLARAARAAAARAGVKPRAAPAPAAECRRRCPPQGPSGSAAWSPPARVGNGAVVPQLLHARDALWLVRAGWGLRCRARGATCLERFELLGLRRVVAVQLLLAGILDGPIPAGRQQKPLHLLLHMHGQVRGRADSLCRAGKVRTTCCGLHSIRPLRAGLAQETSSAKA